MVGDTLAMKCKVRYSAGFAYAPTMTWILAGNRISPSDESTATEAITSYNIAVTQALIGQQFQVCSPLLVLVQSYCFIIFPTAHLANMWLYASYFRSNNPKQ